MVALDEDLPSSILELEPLGPRHEERRFAAVLETLPELLVHFSWAREGYSRDANRAYLANQLTDRDLRVYAAVHRQDGRFLGEVGTSPKGPEDDRRFLSYWIRKSEQRKGYGFAACRELIALEEGALGLYIPSDNFPSRRLATKLGARAVASTRVEANHRKVPLMIYHLAP